MTGSAEVRPPSKAQAPPSDTGASSSEAQPPPPREVPSDGDAAGEDGDDRYVPL
jgi:hypothetical protein